ncbi:MAG: CBM9 family sugar-binding protein, partial [Verrucomicrobiales bacterium]|nr:CBM9 family sugar-binding protein [Verrucomicrobiales bacterium]
IFEGQYTETWKGIYYDGSPSKDAQKGVHWDGTGSLTATGYQVEFKIPKASLGSPADDTSIGFHIAINDDDGVGDYSHIGWTGQAHHEYTYGSLIFSSQGAGTGGGPPKIIAFSYTNGAFGMTVQTTAGAKYDIEYSQDLKSWEVILADVAGTGQAVPVTETDAARKARPFGFYRVRVK